MSLVSMLGKIALGAIAAKGIGKVMGGQGGQSGGGLGGLLGSLAGGGQGGSNPLSGLLGGASGGQGGLGALGSLLGGAGGSSGGLGGLLNSLGGQQAGSSGGLGGLLNQAMSGQVTQQPSADDEATAGVMLKAMIYAAKSDGTIDQAEQAKIAENVGDASPQEMAMVQQLLQEPIDLQSLIASVPAGQQQQVYLMSLLAIDLDSQAEAAYLDQLAQGLGLDQQQANAIHQQLGVPALYS